MKLSEIAKRHLPTMNLDSSYLFEDLFENHVDMEIEYDYQGSDYTDHPYGSTTAREYHDARLDIGECLLLGEVELVDDSGVTDKSLPEGTDMMKTKYWSKDIEESLKQLVYEHLENQKKMDDEDYAADRRDSEY